MKREVPLLLTFLFGAFYVLSNFIVWDRWKLAAENVNNWVLVVIAFTYVLGVGNLLRVHGLKVSRREEGWGYSLTTIVGLLVMVTFGLLLWFLPQTEGSAVFRFRALETVQTRDAVHVSAPLGSGDLFDVRLETALSKDANGDGTANTGDEVECRLAYNYLGSEPLPSALFTVSYGASNLVSLDVPSSTGEEPSEAAGRDGAGAPRAGLSARLDSGSLVWNAGAVETSWFGSLRAGNGQTSVYTWFYDAVYVPMQSTMFALLAFFISSAAFRAFRIRSANAVLLGIAALVVILGSVPVGEAVWEEFPTLVAWVMNCLQTAGKRAILIGAALGAIATGLKMLVGAERGYLSRD